MRRHVAILGAGPAGLAMAVCLQRQGISHTVLERGAEPATGLRRVDPEMELLSPTRISLIPGMRRQPNDPPYLTFPAYIGKLGQVAQERRIAVRTDAGVERVDRSGHGFAVRVRDGTTVECSHVVSATGILSLPRLPSRFEPGAAGYRWLHSIDFRSSHLATTRRLLVVGNGQSAAEVLERWLALHREGDQAWLSVRSRALVLPHWILGIDVHWLAWPLEFLHTRWFGVDRPTLREPVLGLALPRALRRGMVRRVGEIHDFAGPAPVTADGERLEPDLVVFATGFEYALDHVRHLVGSGGRESRVRGCESTNTPGLYLLGLRRCRTFASGYLRGIARDARAVAARIAGN